MGTISNLRGSDKVLAGDGGGPHDPGMEARIDRLDRAVDRIDADLTSIRVSVAKIEERLTHMPTNADLLKVVSGAQTKILWAIAVPVIVAAIKWAWPLLAH